MRRSREAAAAVRVLGLVSLVLSCSTPEHGAAAPGSQPGVGAPAKPAAGVVIAEGLCENPRVRVQLVELKRVEPEIVSAKFALANPGTVPVDIRDAFAEPGSGEAGTLSGVVLVDEVGQKRLFVMRDDQGRPRCSMGLASIPPGGRVEGWARFPAPGQGVQRVALQVPGLQAWRDLHLSDDPSGTARKGPSY